VREMMFRWEQMLMAKKTGWRLTGRLVEDCYSRRV